MSRAEPDSEEQANLGIVCDNCGARWRLPAGWKGTQANCQKCGHGIDARIQLAGRERGGGGSPTPPATDARPAIDRSKFAPAPERAPTRQKAAPKPRADHLDEDGDKSTESSRPRQARDAHKGPRSPLPWILAAGVLAVVVAIVVVATR